MAEENFLTDLEQTLKAVLENIRLSGNLVPVVVVTPDPDFVELALPCLTLQLVDLRRDFSRIDNQRKVEKDLAMMQAKITPAGLPYNLHYLITAHAQTLREDRLLLGELVKTVDSHPVMTSAVYGKEFYLHRDVSFGEASKARDFSQSLGIVAKIRLEPDEEQIISLVRLAKVAAHEY